MLARLRRLRPAARARPADSYAFSDAFMGKFRSRRAALRAHADYPHDTDAEGQFDPGFRTYVRVEDTIDRVPPGTRVLDVGCNSGGLGRRLIAEKGCEMYGVDISEQLVERARAKGYRAHVGAAEELPFEDDLFDVVVVSELLEHVHDPRPVLGEAHRVLRPRGLLLGDVPTERGRWGYETIADHGFHARVFTRDALEALLRELFRVRRLDAVPREGEEHPVYDVPTWYVFECAKEGA